MSLPVVYDSLDRYLVEISRFPLLTREEEHRLAVRWHDEGDIESARRLVTANLKFVVKIALEYRNYGVALKDLIQEGNMGLMTAVKKFNPHKGTRLITYASWWIRSYIQEFILRTRGMVRRGAKTLKKRLFCRAERPEAHAISPVEPIYGATAVEHDPADADVSLDSPMGDDGKTRLDMMASTDADHAGLIADKEERAIVKRDVSDALMALNDKERFVVEKRFLSDEPMSLEDIGKTLSLTRERIRQIEKESLAKLRKILGREKGA